MTTEQVVTLWVAIIGAVTGVVGMVLGIIATWHQLSQNRVRLKVLPKIAFIHSSGIISGDRPTGMIAAFISKGAVYHLCVEVINLSAFPLIIADVGFGKYHSMRHSLAVDHADFGDKLPKKLDPRESMTVYVRPGLDFEPAIMLTEKAFAMTECENVTYGTSPIFREFVRGRFAAKEAKS